MILWSVRHQGSPESVDGLTAEDIVDGVKEGIWDPSDEVMGPNDADWQSMEQHPVFAQAMAEYEPPPPKHHPDETRLDMNPLIDVALVLLIFFIITTTYEELRKEFNPPPGQREEEKAFNRSLQVRTQVALSSIALAAKTAETQILSMFTEEPKYTDTILDKFGLLKKK